MLSTASASYNIQSQVESKQSSTDNTYSGLNDTIRSGDTGKYSSFGSDVRQGTMMKTSTPNAQGETYEMYNWGRNSIQTAEGMIAVDNNWAASGDHYASPANSAIQAILIGGSTTEAALRMNYYQYDYQAGSYDDLGSEIDIYFDGIYDMAVVPTVSPTELQSFATGAATTCTDQTKCDMDGWELITTLCADNNCASSTYESSLYLLNGGYGLERMNWAITTNAVDKTLVYEYRNAFEGDAYEMSVKTSQHSDWEKLWIGDNLQANGNKMQYELQQTGGTGTGQDATAAHFATPISGMTPTAYGCDSTPDSQHTVDDTFVCGELPTTVNMFRKAGDILVFSVSIDYDSLALMNTSGTLTVVTYDPSVSFDSVQFADASAGEGNDWKFGVDRDGCEVYRYSCSASGQKEDYGEYWLGDGWCGDTSISWKEGNAGCRFSGLTDSMILGFDNWNAQAMNTKLASMPLFDSTHDFDGAVIEMEVDRATWQQSANTYGWQGGLNLELGLQSVAYTDGTWFPSMTATTGVDGGWMETCFNGYVDVYALPENVWHVWQNEAKWGYNYGSLEYPASQGGVTNVPNSNKWIIEGDGDAGWDEYGYSKGVTKVDQFPFSDGPNYERPHAGTSYVESNSKYWEHPNQLGYSGDADLTDAEMKINMFHAQENDAFGGYGFTPFNDHLFDKHFEQGGSGVNDKPGKDADIEFASSSFNQVADYWDINFYNPGNYNVKDSASQNSGLATYHVNTVELGSETTDFCYDPISWSAQDRDDSTGASIESEFHIKHDTSSGESILNIPLKSGYGASPLTDSTFENGYNLLNKGWVDSETDDTIGIVFLIDIRGRSSGINPTTGTLTAHKPQTEVCWGDWAGGTEEIDEISDDVDDFCLDEGGLVLNARNNKAFSSFSGETPCRNAKPPTSGGLSQSGGNNPDEAFWCGLNLDTPFSDWESFRLMGMTLPVTETFDDDNDGVDNDVDDCPDTLEGAVVDDVGCSQSQNNDRDPDFDEDNNTVTIYNAYQNDVDNDGVKDSNDICDRLQNSWHSTYVSGTRTIGYGLPTSLNTENRYGGPNGPSVYWGNQDLYGVEIRGAAADINSYTAAVADAWELVVDLTTGNRQGVGPTGCPSSEPVTDPDPLPIGACTAAEPDNGLINFAWEDNDNDGQYDEDWHDGFDNDNDGLIDEDRIDDCDLDQITWVYDSQFTGALDLSQATNINGTYNLHISGKVVAENNTGIASGNSYKTSLWNASDTNWDSIYGTGGNAGILAANAMMIQDDGYLTERFSCVALTGIQATQMRMYVDTWVPDENHLRTDMIYSEWTTSPYGDVNDGFWAPYGKTSFDGTTNGDDYGWYEGLTEKHRNDVAASTSAGVWPNRAGPYTTNTAIEMPMAEGYYKITCVATQEATITSSTGVTTTTSAQARTSMVVLALEPCDNGISPTLEDVNGLQYTTTWNCDEPPVTGGGSDIGESAGDFWDALIGSAIALVVLAMFIALASLLWFIDRKESAVGVTLIGLGFASAFFIESVPLEETTANLWGTIAHLFIAGGIITAFLPYDNQPGKVAAVSATIGVWGLIHSLNANLDDGLNLGGLEDYLIPAISGAAITIAVIGLALGIFGAAVELQIVDDPTGLLEED